MPARTHLAARNDLKFSIGLVTRFTARWTCRAMLLRFGHLLPDDWLTQCSYWMSLHQIDLSEASAMVLAQHSQAQGDSALLAMDDFRGRYSAQYAGMAMVGTTGLLLLAKQAGLVNSVKPLLLTLRQNGYFLSDRLIAAALRQAGELDLSK